MRRAGRPSRASSRWRRTSRTCTSAASPATCGRPPPLPPEDAMQALWTIARFDFSRRLRMLSTWVYFVLYGAVAGLWTAAAAGAVPGARVSFGGDKILVDSPYALAIGISVLALTGIMV